MQKLRVGRIKYANLFPYFYLLEKERNPEIEFVDGHPSELNILLRNGKLDISPSSSIEYLKNEDLYDIITSHSISSEGKVRSIILFSRRPIEKLDSSTILATSRSDTSAALLEIILKKFYNFDIQILKSNINLSEATVDYPAYLLIGDDAMVEAYKDNRFFHYDIGELWYRFTGLPSVFALWIARKESIKMIPHLIFKFKKSLDHVKNLFPSYLNEISKACPLSEIIGELNLLNYWETLSYGFTEEHKKGLALFKKYAQELGII